MGQLENMSLSLVQQGLAARCEIKNPMSVWWNVLYKHAIKKPYLRISFADKAFVLIGWTGFMSASPIPSMNHRKDGYFDNQAG